MPAAPASRKKTTQSKRPLPAAKRSIRRPAKPRRTVSTPKATGWNLKKLPPETLWFGLLMLVAMIFRWLRPDWYLHQQFHPDERWIFGVVSQLSYPEAPSGLQYGTFPLYLLAIIKDAAGWVAGWFGPFDANHLVIAAGRMLSAVFDLGTLIFTYLLGQRMLPGAQGRRLGLLAAAFLSFTVLNIQMAHFFVVDVPLGLTVMATLYAAAGIAQFGRRQDYVLAGIFLGLAMATKTSALPVSLAVGVAHLIGISRVPESEQRQRWLDLGLAVLVSLLAFFIAMPHAILDWSRFWSNQNEQRRILVTGEADVPYNRQYLHTLPFVYFGKNLILYTMGLPLGILSLAAFSGYAVTGLVNTALAAIRKTWKPWLAVVEANAALIISLTFGVVYTLVIGTSFAKFNRYLLPLTPILCLAAAHLIFLAWERIQSGVGRKFVTVVSGLVLLGTFLWALAFISIYQAEHPWIAASRWMLGHIPATVQENNLIRPTAILNEEWGDDLPVGVEGVPGKAYRNNKFSVQEPDTPQKRAVILSMLPQNDWIVMADTRAHAVYRRLPERYPINAAYYQLMFAGRLGFHLAKDFSNYPRLFGHVFADDRADESFTLYDHPHVYLFERDAQPLSPEESARRLDAGIAQVKARMPNPAPVPATAALAAPAPAQPVGLPTVVNKNIGQTQARPVFVLGRLNSFTAALAWILLLEFIGLLALPLTLRLFSQLADGGAALAKIVGTLVFTWIVWLLVSLGLIQHRQGASLIVLLALGAAVLVWARYHQEELLAAWRKYGRLWASTEIVFLAVFVGYLLTKLYNPDIHNPFGQGYNGGGEPMGMTFFSAVYKSLHFPPYDPWLSGYHINYYYYGHVILGILAKLIGVPPAWSYNIVIALLLALTATGLYGLGLALTGKRRWGVVAALAGVAAGNLQTFFYLLEPLNRGINLSEGLFGVVRWLQETWQHAGRFEFIWNPTRLIKGTINEMPWFSFLYGDLHAHIIAIPFSLPLIGWGLNLLLRPAAPSDKFPEAPGKSWAERGLNFFMVALFLGSLSAINTWNFPPYALLVLSVLIAKAFQAPRRRGRIPWRDLGYAVLGWLRLLVLGILLFTFFHHYFVPQSTSLAFVNPAVRTQLKDFLIFFGLPVFALLTLWAQELLPVLEKWLRSLGWFSRPARSWWQRCLDLPQAFWLKQPRVFYLTITALVLAGLLVYFDQALLAVLFALLLIGGYVLGWRPLRPALQMAMLLAVLGVAMVFGCELVHIRDFMGVGGDMSRMNTVFKFYMIIWIFFALALTAALAEIWKQKRSKHQPAWLSGKVALWSLGILTLWAIGNYYQVVYESFWLTVMLGLGILVLPWIKAGSKQEHLQTGWQAMLLAIAVCVALYPPISLYNRMHLCSEFKNPTLNGEAYLDRLNPQDAKALAWINENIRRADIVLEAPGHQGYNCFDTRVAVFTGQPTLMGWIGEEEQMRYKPALTDSHTADANLILGTPDINQARQLMEKYRVQYVYIGANERKAFPPIGLDKFSQFMDTVYSQDGVAIYKVRNANERL